MSDRRRNTLPFALTFSLLLSASSVAAYGPAVEPVAPPRREAGANTAELWSEVPIPEDFAELGLKVGGNEEVFLSFAVHLRDQLTQGDTPAGVAGELDPTAFALWFITGGADGAPVFHLPALPGTEGETGGFVSPVEAYERYRELLESPGDEELSRYLRDLGRRLDFIVAHAETAALNWLAPLASGDRRWSNLLQGGDPLAVDAALAEFDQSQTGMDPEMLGAADAAYSQLQDQAALHALARELTSAARTGDAGVTAEALNAFHQRLIQANLWRSGYPDDDFRRAYATYHRLPILDWTHYAYGLAVLLFLAALVFSRPRLSWLGVGAVGLGFVGHTIFLALRWILSGHSPTSGMFEFLVLLSWCIVGAFLYFALRREAHYAGLGAMALVFGIWALTGIAEPRIVQQLMPALQSVWMILHVGLTAVGEGFMAAGMVFAVLYLIKSRTKRPRRAGLLPGTLELEEYSYKSLLISFPFYTLGGIVAGMIWAEQAWGSWWSWDPKETLALFVWLVLVLFLHARRVKPWRDRRLAWLALLPFILAVLNLLSNLIIRGLHAYG